MTWKELKDFCNDLSSEHLNGNVVLWREDECLNDIFPRILEENFYIDSDNWDNGCIPESECLNIVNDNVDDYPNGLEDLSLCYEKGYPILEEEL